MSRLAALCLTVLLLGGCAVPLPLTVASWAVDGISLMTTDKTLTDHGLSAVAGRDCALWRGLTEGDICRDDRGNILMTAYGAPGRADMAPVTEVAAVMGLEGPYLKVR